MEFQVNNPWMHDINFYHLLIFVYVLYSNSIGTSVGDKDGVSTGWPVFKIPDKTASEALRYVTPAGYMLGFTLYAQGR